MAGPSLPASFAPELPVEILLEIVGYIPTTQADQSTLHSCTLVSRSWYSAAIARLYQSPYIHGGNFDSFVRTICPSINAHIRKSPLSELVRVLDMGKLVHNGSRSLTARILARMRDNVEVLVAPRATFSLVSKNRVLLFTLTSLPD